MMDVNAIRVRIVVCWGSFDSYGNWAPNHNLSLSIDEQFRQNVEGGYMTNQGRMNPTGRRT